MASKVTKTNKSLDGSIKTSSTCRMEDLCSGATCLLNTDTEVAVGLPNYTRLNMREALRKVGFDKE